jgi:hypothetical protein
MSARPRRFAATRRPPKVNSVECAQIGGGCGHIMSQRTDFAENPIECVSESPKSRDRLRGDPIRCGTSLIHRYGEEDYEPGSHFT